jgi:hypothetical protein
VEDVKFSDTFLLPERESSTKVLLASFFPHPLYLLARLSFSKDIEKIDVAPDTHLPALFVHNFGSWTDTWEPRQHFLGSLGFVPRCPSHALKGVLGQHQTHVVRADGQSGKKEEVGKYFCTNCNKNMT